MFRLEGYCDDKNVVLIMKLLAGKVMEFKMVPVVNAQAKNGKVTAKTSGDPLELLAAWLKQNKTKEVSGKQLHNFTAEIGKSRSYYYTLVTRAREAKMIKRKPGTSNHAATYQVLS